MNLKPTLQVVRFLKPPQVTLSDGIHKYNYIFIQPWNIDDFGSKIAFNTLLIIEGYKVSEIDGQMCITINKFANVPNTVHRL